MKSGNKPQNKDKEVENVMYFVTDEHGKPLEYEHNPKGERKKE